MSALRGPVRSKGSERGRSIPQTARIRWSVLVGFGLAAVGNLLTAFGPSLVWPSPLRSFVVRVSALIDTNVQTVLQRESDPEKLGRVMANVWGGVGVTAASSVRGRRAAARLDISVDNVHHYWDFRTGLHAPHPGLCKEDRCTQPLTLIYLMRVEGRGDRAVLLSGTWVWGTSGHTGVAEALAAVLCVRDHGGRRGACLARSRTSWWSGR